MTKPLVVDLYCGLGGWTEGFLSEGYRARGYDIEAHAYGDERYPGDLVVRDVLQMHGSEVADADVIVGSSPCQEYSYMAMPWTLAKAKAAAIRADETGELLRKLNALFNAQFRIQREACEAAGRHIPMVVENVRGAQDWVGRAGWNFGSYYLWGDIPALMPKALRATKVPGFRFDGSGGSFQTASVEGTKVAAEAGRRTAPGLGARFTSRDCGVEGEATRQAQVQRPAKTGDPERPRWFNDGPRTPGSLASSSSSSARKAASAKIAKIPFALSSHIARVYKP